MKLHSVLSAKFRPSPAVALTLVRVHRWVSSLVDDGLPASRIAAKAELEPGSDVVERIAESIVENAPGIERKLLSKSLQEALLYCIRFDPALDYARFKTRFSRHVNRQGTSAFMQRFLSLFFFNQVWFQVSDAFQSATKNADSLSKDLKSVEAICRHVVREAWESYEQTSASLDARSAKKLIDTITRSLT